MKKAIHEIIEETEKAKNNNKKVEVLKKNDCPPLRMILKFTYDKDNIHFLIPNYPPPYKESGLIDIEGRMYVEAKRLRIFVKGGGYDNLNQTKRERIFIEILESVKPEDAKVLLQMISQKPFKGVPRSVVEEAFPEMFPHKTNA